MKATVILPLLGQRQDSVSAQLDDLARVAVRLGMYDAADWIQDTRRDGIYAVPPSKEDKCDR